MDIYKIKNRTTLFTVLISAFIFLLGVGVIFAFYILMNETLGELEGTAGIAAPFIAIIFIILMAIGAIFAVIGLISFFVSLVLISQKDVHQYYKKRGVIIFSSVMAFIMGIMFAIASIAFILDKFHPIYIMILAGSFALIAFGIMNCVNYSQLSKSYQQYL